MIVSVIEVPNSDPASASIIDTDRLDPANPEHAGYLRAVLAAVADDIQCESIPTDLAQVYGNDLGDCRVALPAMVDAQIVLYVE